MRAGALLVATLVVVGCGAAMWASVPVSGSDASLSALAGKWQGSFEGATGASKGLIKFELSEGSKFAAGEVVFNASDPAKASSVPFKQVEAGEAGKIRGVIGPYVEPQLKVQVQTQFVGTRKGSTMSGTFTTRAVDSSNHQQTGRWEMKKL